MVANKWKIAVPQKFPPKILIVARLPFLFIFNTGHFFLILSSYQTAKYASTGVD